MDYTCLFSRNVSINITFRSIEEVTPFNLIQHYFSRNPDSELHFPHCICGPIVQRELKYWNISDDRIASCCWKFYRYFPKYLLVFRLRLNKILLQATTNWQGNLGTNFVLKYFTQGLESFNFAAHCDNLNLLRLFIRFAENLKMKKKRWMS